jgi:uncharacterized protein (TIGR02271 family)
VRGADGERVGTVTGVEPEQLVVSRGPLGMRRLVLPRTEVRAVRPGHVELRCAAADAGHAPSPWLDGSEVRLPLVHEEVEPRVTVHECGRVRVRKVVRVEERHVTVQVRREELVVEHLPLAPGEPPRSGGAPFEPASHVFTLWQDEVEVHTRPVPYEEVRVSKSPTSSTWHRRVPLRFEVARVEEEGDVQVLPSHAAPPAGGRGGPPGH